uniref:DUF4408 domain-containing protein n=1 Tax=Oryza punctata TaxID=4537 RepID=A0A0E0KWS5_ORYPU
MSYSYASRRRGGGGGGGMAATVLAAKVAFAAAAVAGAGSFARLAVPQLVSVAGAVFPRVWAAARVWLVPPYLFVTVHLIILVIWKLSDHKHFQAQQQQHKDPWPHPHPAVPVAAVLPSAAEDAPSLVVKTKEEFGAAAAVYGGGMPEHEESPEISPDSGSGGGESCVTTESDEDASTAASYTSDARRNLAPPPQEHSVLEREFSLPLPAVAATAVDIGRDDAAADDDDDLDATWNAIMQKTRPATAPAMAAPPAQKAPAAGPPPPRARDPDSRSGGSRANRVIIFRMWRFQNGSMDGGAMEAAREMTLISICIIWHLNHFIGMAWFLASHRGKGHETEPSLLQEQLNDCDLATTNPTTPIPQDATQILIVIATSDTLIIPGSNTSGMDKSLLKLTYNSVAANAPAAIVVTFAYETAL